MSKETLTIYCLKKLNILPLYSQHIFSLSTYVVKYTDAFKSTSAIHSINCRPGFDLHPPTTYLTKGQKAVHYCRIKLFNNLPLNIKQLSHDTNKIKLALKKFLPAGSFQKFKEKSGYVLEVSPQRES